MNVFKTFEHAGFCKQKWSNVKSATFFELRNLFTIEKNGNFTRLWQTEKHKFFWSKIFSKFSRIICPISAETIANFINETQLRILNNVRKYDSVILIDCIRIF